MFSSLFNKCGKIYVNTLPTMITFSGTSGLLTGIGNYVCDSQNKDYPKPEIPNFYTYMIGYTSLGIVTGLIYPISFPLCAYHVCSITPSD